jgi:hypothetical protein
MRTLALALFALVPFGLFAAEASADPPRHSRSRHNREWREHDRHRHTRDRDWRDDGHRHGHHWDSHAEGRYRDGYRYSQPFYDYGYRRYDSYRAPYGLYDQPRLGFGISTPRFSIWLGR